MLNLVLVTVALAVGGLGPNATGPASVARTQSARPSTGPITGAASLVPSESTPPAASTTPSASGAPGSLAPASVEPLASSTPGASGQPGSSPEASLEPSGEPFTPPASSQPAAGSGPQPGGSTQPTRTPGPSRAPQPSHTPQPTRTPAPSTIPAAPSPTPAARPLKARPPCPGSVDGPPGHNKTSGDGSRPCGHGPKSHGDKHGNSGWLIVLFPLSGSSAASWRMPGVRRRRRQR